MLETEDAHGTPVGLDVQRTEANDAHSSPLLKDNRNEPDRLKVDDWAADHQELEGAGEVDARWATYEALEDGDALEPDHEGMEDGEIEDEDQPRMFMLRTVDIDGRLDGEEAEDNGVRVTGLEASEDREVREVDDVDGGAEDASVPGIGSRTLIAGIRVGDDEDVEEGEIVDEEVHGTDREHSASQGKIY